MKRIYLLLAICLIATATIKAQKKNVNLATMAITQNQLKKAKDAIDAATEDEQTKNASKTWIVRGDVYWAIHQDLLKKFPDLDKEALEKSYQAYNKAIEAGEAEMKAKAAKKGKKVKPFKKKEELQKKIADMSPAFKQKGIDAYNNKDYKKALTMFERGLEIDKMPQVNKKDTVFIYYSALMAEETKAPEKALKYYNEAIALNYGENETLKNEDGTPKLDENGKEIKSSATAAEIYFRKGNLLMQKGDTAQAVEVFKQSVSKYKESTNSVIQLIQYFLNTNKTTEAEKYLLKALETEPENATYHFAMGTLYDTRSQKAEEKNERKKLQDEATKYYKNAIKYDGKHKDAYYNLGAIYYNNAAKIIEEAGKLPMNKQKEYEAKKKEANDIFRIAMPYFENVVKIDGNEEGAIKSLITIYGKLGMKDKENEMREKLK